MVTAFTTATIPTTALRSECRSGGSFAYDTPSCSIAPSDCPGLNAAWSAQSHSDTFPAGICTCPPGSGCAFSSQCTISASSVQLYYWPQTTIGTPTCDGPSGLSWATAPAPTGNRTAVLTLPWPGTGNMTGNATTIATSPTVYLAVSGVNAGVLVGTRFSGYGSVTAGSTLLSIAPQDLSSVVQHLTHFTGDWTSEVDYLLTAAPGPNNSYAATELHKDEGNIYTWAFSQTALP